MTETNIETTTSSSEEQKREHTGSHHKHSHHHHSHHSGSHHSSSHHHHSHHGSSHHSSSHHSSSRHSSDSSRSKKSRSSKRYRYNKKFSLSGFLEKTALISRYKSRPNYRKISQRILFCVFFFAAVIAVITGITYNWDNHSASKPGYARSVADQLRGQITVLQLEKAELQKKLDRYIELYGELDAPKSNTRTK